MAALRQKRRHTQRMMNPLRSVGLRGANNWAKAQLRTASYSSKGFWRLAISMTLTFGFVLLCGLWLGGYLSDARYATSQFMEKRLVSMGFVIDQVDVLGEGRLSERDVRRALGVNEGDFLFGLDVQAAQRRVESLSWVDRAIVRRLWPDRIVVQIIERRPYALWQHQGQIDLVDYDGTVISGVDTAQYAHLNLVVGDLALDHMQDVHTITTLYPGLASRIDAYVHKPSGQWDIHLDDRRVIVRLPSENIGTALANLEKLQTQTQVLDRKIRVIDLRLSDRVTLSPAQAEPA